MHTFLELTCVTEGTPSEHFGPLRALGGNAAPCGALEGGPWPRGAHHEDGQVEVVSRKQQGRGTLRPGVGSHPHKTMSVLGIYRTVEEALLLGFYVTRLYVTLPM